MLSVANVIKPPAPVVRVAASTGHSSSAGTSASESTTWSGSNSLLATSARSVMPVSTSTVVMPARSDADATHMVAGWTGVGLEFADGHTRYVAVPKKTLLDVAAETEVGP